MCAAPASEREMQPTEELVNYRVQYPSKPMARTPNNGDETVLMPAGEGAHELPSPPTTHAEFPRPTGLPTSTDAAPDARHLWVIRPTDVPVALELCAWGSDLESKCIKHSNLTGGDSAHSGGEIWFIDDDRIAINANSGRYGASSDDEFRIIVDALRRSGYHVASMGFDLDTPSIPNSIFIGDPVWEPPL
jgi:hypothetical protein